MNKNKKICLVVVGVIILVGVFYGGVVYGKKGQNRVAMRGQGVGAQAFGAGNFTGGARAGRGGMGGFTTGEIIAKDDKSITVKLNGATPEGGQGSKIIFLGTDTKISKSVDGLASDLVSGTQVSVTGAANSDGSINATTVQIRPKTPSQQ